MSLVSIGDGGMDFGAGATQASSSGPTKRFVSVASRLLNIGGALQASLFTGIRARIRHRRSALMNSDGTRNAQ